MKFLDNHGEKILYITWGILFLIILIAGCDVKALAASSGSTEIPYNVSEMKSYNEMMLDRVEIARTYFYQVFPQYSDYSVLIWTDDGFYTDFYYQYIFMFEPEFNSSIADSYDFTSNPLEFYSDYEIFAVIIGSDGSTQGILEPHSHYASLMGNAQSVQTSVGAYLPRYPFYYNGDPILSTNGIEVLINNVSGGSAVQGHSIQPNLEDDNVDPNDLPDISNHQPTIPSPPTVDTTSPSTLLNSIFEILKWGFNALISSINGFMSYIEVLFSYLFQLLINNIKNAINNIYQNFANLFEPLLNALSSLNQNISDKVDYITASLDPSVISTGIESTDLVSDVTGYKTSLNTFVGSFNNVSEPSTYKIPIHFENISMFSDVGVQYIDLGWLNSVKTLIRGFVACLVTYGVIISIFDSVPNYINGGGGEDD